MVHFYSTLLWLSGFILTQETQLEHGAILFTYYLHCGHLLFGFFLFSVAVLSGVGHHKYLVRFRFKQTLLQGKIDKIYFPAYVFLRY